MRLDDLSESKSSKSEAGYQAKPHAGQKCLYCTMWRDPNRCTAVAGSISPDGWCDWWQGGARGKHGRIKEIRMIAGVPDDIDFTQDSQNQKYLSTLEKTPYTVGGFAVYHRLLNQEHTFNVIDDRAKPLRILGDLTMSPYENGFYESTIRFSKEIRGRGLASQLYAIAIIKFKIRVISDNQQTPGSKKLWHELVTNHPNIYTYIIDEYEETVRPATAENFHEAYLGDDEDIRLVATATRMKTSVNEDGRIVRGVNTTVDVGVDQTRIEAAKFGNRVTRDGFPPTLTSNGKRQAVEERRADPVNLAKRTAKIYGKEKDYGYDKSETIPGKYVPLKGFDDDLVDEMEAAVHEVVKSLHTDPADRYRSAARKKLMSNSVPQTVNIRDLTPTQPFVRIEDEDTLRDKVKTNKRIPIVKYKNRLFVRDGHHAVFAAKLRGETTMEADVLDLDKFTKGLPERYTALEWAAIQGGHTLESDPPKKLFDWLNK
jgi:hypothetical protein